MRKVIMTGMVAWACNPTLGRQKQEDLEFKASLGYIARLYSVLEGRRGEMGRRERGRRKVIEDRN
jgi:hypothetical protein